MKVGTGGHRAEGRTSRQKVPQRNILTLFLSPLTPSSHKIIVVMALFTWVLCTWLVYHLINHVISNFVLTNKRDVCIAWLIVLVEESLIYTGLHII